MVKWINVSTSQHQLKLFDGNRLLKTYPIAVGKNIDTITFWNIHDYQ